MCLICLDFDRGFMSIPDAVRALSEFVTVGAIPSAHVAEIKEKIKARALAEVTEMNEKTKNNRKGSKVSELDTDK